MDKTKLAAAIAILVIGIAGFFLWQKFDALGMQIANLSGQVEDLGGRLQEAEQLADQAEQRADQAEESADQATLLAAQANERELASAQKAIDAELARQDAETRQQEATAKREEAERRADAAAVTAAAAEEKRAIAEKKQAELALAAAEAEVEARDTRLEKERLERRMERELNRLERALGRIADTRRTALGLVMTLDSSEIEFDFNETTLRPKNREVLSRIAGVLMTFQDYGIQIFGHTDDVGSVDYNALLSKQRAETVRDYLIEAGVAPEVVTTMGLGKSSPLVQGTDDVSRQRNRRVELAIVFSEGEYEDINPEDGTPAEGVGG